MLNGGGIRAARKYHERFTYGDLEAEVPFDNEVVVVALPGAVLREAIAASRAHAPAESGGFLQACDALTVDPTTHVLSAVAGAPLDEKRTYRVALIRNMLTGMDHVEPLMRWGTANAATIPHEDSGRGVRSLLVESFADTIWEELGGFDGIDTNHDGVVSAEEVAAALERVNHERASQLAVDVIVSALDHDHDHAVSREEAEALLPHHKKP